MALVFRWYLGQSSHWANAGEPSRTVDYQVWCGPAMGAFNEWVARRRSWNSPRTAAWSTVALNILYGAAVLTAPDAWASQGIAIPAGIPTAAPLELAELRTA